MNTAAHITVSSGPTTLCFSAAEHGALVAVQHAAEGENLISGTTDLWIVELEDTELRSGGADRFEWGTREGGAWLRWAFNAPAVQVEVHLTAQEPEGALAAHWSLRCLSGAEVCLREVHFPRFQAAPALDRILRPACSYWPEIPVEQYLRTDWDEAELARMNEAMVHDGVCAADGYYGGLYPGAWACVPFFAAWSRRDEGLYLGAHDPQAFTKTLLWDHRRVAFTYHVPDPDLPRAELAVPYPLVLAAFRGDWHAGADLYRNWAARHVPWCRRGPLTDTAPDWACDSVAWFYYLGDFPLPLAELLPRLRELFGLEGPIGVHQLGPNVQDHSNMPLGELDPWLLDYKQRTHRLAREHGYFVFEYRNAHKYTKDYPGYESARPSAFRWQGRLHEEGPYGGGPGFRTRSVPPGAPGSRLMGVEPDAYGEAAEFEQYPLVEMCIGTDYWRRKLLDAVAPCPSYGLVGNYLDQIGHNQNMSRCDAVGHDHPVRGGDWYVRGHEQVLEQIRRHYRLLGVPRPLLSHESFCEPLVGLLNAALLDGDLRLISYLYHPYLLLESHEPYSGMQDLPSLRRALARDFHEGRMPALNLPCSLPGVDMTALLRDPPAEGDLPEAIRMIRHWLRTRAGWLAYLNLGTMLPPPPLAPGSGEAITSAWRSPQGDVALFASNATDRVQPLVLNLDTYPPATWRAWLNDRRPAPAAREPFCCDLAPDDTVILEAPAT